jgi:hypothetical protein
VYVTDKPKLTDTVEDVVGDSGDDAVDELDVVSVHRILRLYKMFVSVYEWCKCQLVIIVLLIFSFFHCPVVQLDALFRACGCVDVPLIT